MKTTMGNSRRKDELTPTERKFALLRMQGYSQTQAYRVAFNRMGLEPSDASKRASEVANRPRVVGYVKSLYREAKKLDLVSHAEYIGGLLDDLEHSRANDNWTAAASFQRLIGQAIGTLSETVKIDDERLTESQLLDRLGSNDPVLAERIKALTKAKQQFDA